MKKKEKEYRLAVDMKTGRPGCVLLQAVYGAEGDFSFFLSGYVDIWLLAPTDNMGCVKGSESTFKKLFDINLKEKKEGRGEWARAKTR